MKKETKESPGHVEIDLTPMIDVVFNLVIFFMLITDMAQKEIEDLELPWSAAAKPDAPESNDRRVIVNISKAPGFSAADPRIEIRVKGVVYQLERLRELLFKHAEVDREDLETGASGISVLIRCDADIRWREVQWVMQACSTPPVSIYKVEFATRKPREEGEGG